MDILEVTYKTIFVLATISLVAGCTIGSIYTIKLIQFKSAHNVRSWWFFSNPFNTAEKAIKRFEIEDSFSEELRKIFNLRRYAIIALVPLVLFLSIVAVLLLAYLVLFGLGMTRS